MYVPTSVLQYSVQNSRLQIPSETQDVQMMDGIKDINRICYLILVYIYIKRGGDLSCYYSTSSSQMPRDVALSHTHKQISSNFRLCGVDIVGEVVRIVLYL